MVKIERLEEFQAQGDKCVALLYEKNNHPPLLHTSREK